jgi:hypothetical protein
MFRIIHLSILVVFVLFVGCVPLTEVHNYATSSVEALDKVNSVDYTYRDYCQQNCELQQMRIGELNPNFNCNCVEAASNADEAMRKINSTIKAYLEAVAQLSNNKEFTYDVSGLTSALQNSTLLKLSDKQVSVSTKAGNFIATAATTFYRKKKLKKYLIEADTIFQQLTETYIYLIDNRLRAQLQSQYDARLPNIKQALDNAGDKGLKQIFVKQYLDQKAYYNKHNFLIDTYVALLKLVQKGYHELYIHRYNLKDVNTRALLLRYTKELQYLASTLQ